MDGLHNGVAQVLGADGRHVGMATLVEADGGIALLVTCAHVVRDAVANPRYDPHVDGVTTVRLRWSHSPDLKGRGVVQEEGWTAKDEFGRGDVAVIRYEGKLPTDVAPVDLIDRVDLDAHVYHVYGAARKDPNLVRATGTIGGPEGPAATWLALHADEKSRRIEPGFSGSAVWDESLQHVVGIVVAREKGDDSSRSFFIPNHQLARAWSRMQRIVRSSFEVSKEAREHWLPRARGVTSAFEGGWYFTGREVAVDELTRAARIPETKSPRFFVVAGPPGAGKSGILARLPILADVRLARLATRSFDDVSLPGVSVFPIYLRQKSGADFYEALREKFGGDFDSIEGLLDRISADSRLKSRPKILVLDGLDEAADETSRLRIARDIKRIAIAAPMLNLTVVASCRSGVRDSENERLIGALGTRCERLDVDSPRYVSREDFRRFVENRLLDETDTSSPYHGQDEKVEAIAKKVSAAAFPIYLVAQLVTRSLIDDPELSEADLDVKKFPSNVADAFDDYLGRFESDEMRARNLMAGLAHARGAGFTRGDLWLKITRAVSGVEYQISDIDWILSSAAAFLIESVSEKNAPRYRLYHQALVDMLQGGNSSIVYDECVASAQVAEDGNDSDYFRSHLSGHALAAGRLPDLLTDASALMHCSFESTLRDSSRPDVALPLDASRARAAIRAIQPFASEGANRSAYLRMAGHQYDVQPLATIPSSGSWTVQMARWRASSEHTSIARGRPFTRLAHVTFADENIVVAGDADGRVSFEPLDGSGTSIQEINFPGSVMNLDAVFDTRQAIIVVGLDNGEVYLVRLTARSLEKVRVERFAAPVVSAHVSLEGSISRLIMCAADGTYVVQQRRGLRLQSRRSAPLGQAISASAPLRGGRSFSAFATPENLFGTVRLEDLAPTDESLIHVADNVYQVFDAWYEPDEESSALFSSQVGISRVGLEYGHVEAVIAHQVAGRFRAALTTGGECRFVLSDGTSLVKYDGNGLEIGRLRGHEDQVLDVIEVPTSDGPRIASAAEDGSIRLWGTGADGIEVAEPSIRQAAVWPEPFSVVYLERQRATLVAAGQSTVLSEHATRIGFLPDGSIEVRDGPEGRRVEFAMWARRASESWESDSIHRMEMLEPVEWIEGWPAAAAWAALKWTVRGRSFSLSVSDAELLVGEMNEDELYEESFAAPGVSLRASSPGAVVGYVVGEDVYLFVADGTWLRVFDDSLSVLTEIAISGGPSSSLDVRVVVTEGLVRACFALLCESGLIAGEIQLTN